MHKRFARQTVEKVLHGHFSHALASLLRGTAQVRGDHQIVQAQQRMISRQRFGFCHIQGRGMNPALLQGLGERRGVDHGTARC